MAFGNGRFWQMPLMAVAAVAVAIPAAQAQTGGATQPQERSPQQQSPQQQSPQMRAPAPGQSGQGAAISDDQLKAFALAATQVRDINTSYQPRIAEAEAEKDSGKSATLRKEAQDKMMQAVSAHGLDVETYNKIYVTARADPSVWSRIVEYMKKPQ